MAMCAKCDRPAWTDPCTECARKEMGLNINEILPGRDGPRRGRS